MSRSLVIILDSVGCGHAPDAADYGDAGADTLGHLFARIPDFSLPALASLGLYKLLGLSSPATRPGAQAFRLTEESAGKDTTTGHWELMGAVITEPFATFARFPDDLVAAIEARGNVRFIGNTTASGTAIISELGAEHMRSGKPILYTSADSVLQIAAHEGNFGLQRLHDLCHTARAVLDERNLQVGRVIARPFIGDEASGFTRTANRHDYSLVPPLTVLNRLQTHGITTHGIGKISDIFAHSGIGASHPTISNAHGMEKISELWRNPPSGDHFILANLVDFDMLYGHRRDPAGYAAALRAFDSWLADFLPLVRPSDFLAITADHGNDPYHPGTDHTREQVPLLTLGQPSVPAKPAVFSDLARLLATHHGLQTL